MKERYLRWMKQRGAIMGWVGLSPGGERYRAPYGVNKNTSYVGGMIE